MAFETHLRELFEESKSGNTAKVTTVDSDTQETTTTSKRKYPELAQISDDKTTPTGVSSSASTETATEAEEKPPILLPINELPEHCPAGQA